MDVAAILAFDETARDFLCRAVQPPILAGLPLFNAEPVRAGSVVELCCAGASGKTSLLIQCAAQTLGDGLDEGPARDVFFFDADGRFDLIRLLRCLEADYSVPRERFEEALSRFWLIRCYSLLDLVSAACSVRPAVRAAATRAGHPPLVLVDSVSSYWTIEKASRPTSPSAPMAPAGVHQALAAAVRGMAKHDKAVVLLATSTAGPTLRRGASESVSWDFRPALPAPWQGCVTHRVLIQRAPMHSASQDEPGTMMLACPDLPRSGDVVPFWVTATGVTFAWTASHGGGIT